MVTFIGALCIVAAGSWIGFGQAARLAQRPLQIRQLIHVLQRLATEIDYARTALPEAIVHSASFTPDPVQSLFVKVVHHLRHSQPLTFQQCWQLAMEQGWPQTTMKRSEQLVLLRLGASLGGSHSQDQLKYLQLTIQQLMAEEEQARAEQQRYEKMSKSLGILIAILIVILLV